MRAIPFLVFPLSDKILNLMHVFPSYMKQPTSGSPRPEEEGSDSSRKAWRGARHPGVLEGGAVAGWWSALDKGVWGDGVGQNTSAGPGVGRPDSSGLTAARAQDERDMCMNVCESPREGLQGGSGETKIQSPMAARP